VLTDKITKEILDDLYTNQKISMDNIAKKFGCGETTIWKYMKLYNIPRRKRSELLKGRKQTLEHRQKLADTRHRNRVGVGDSNHNWKGGVFLNARAVTGIAYWRNTVKRRDNFTCQSCGKDGKIECACCGLKTPLHVHHIKSWKDHPELRFDISNGITLCEKCHRTV
jgi:hypothetical protein